MPLSLVRLLGLAIRPTPMRVVLGDSTVVTCLGEVTVHVCIQDLCLDIDFYVMNLSESSFNMILGDRFLRKYQGTLCYRKDRIKFHSLPTGKRWFSTLTRCITPQRANLAKLSRPKNCTNTLALMTPSLLYSSWRMVLPLMLPKSKLKRICWLLNLSMFQTLFVTVSKHLSRRLPMFFLMICRRVYHPIGTIFMPSQRTQTRSHHRNANSGWGLKRKRSWKPSVKIFGPKVIFNQATVPMVPQYCLSLKRTAQRACVLIITVGALNKQTIPNRFPMPRIDDILDNLAKAKVFSSIDLRQTYYQIRLKEEDVPKTAFTTHFGLFEYRVMPFGLANAPATFQNQINDTLRDLLNKSVIGYLDDILIYS